MNDNDYIINKDNYTLTKHELLNTIDLLSNDSNIDLYTCSTSQFNYILSLVCDKYFKYNNILHNDGYNADIPAPEYNLDIDILHKLCDIYISLCKQYNKAISIHGYCDLTDIDQEIIISYSNYNISDKKYKLYKRLNNTREGFIKDKLIDSNNVVGAIAVANSEFGWNNGQQQGNTTINILSADNLPGLVASLQNKGLQVPTQGVSAPLPESAVNYHE